MVKTRVKNKPQTGYGQYTIGSLIYTLQELVNNNDYLTMNSPVFISDYAMSGLKHEMDVLPTFSPYLHQAGLCLFHSLNEPMANDIPVTSNVTSEEEGIEEEDVTYEEEDHTLLEAPQKVGITRFMKWYKG